MLKVIFNNEKLGYFTNHQDTPLHIASEKGHLEVAKCLIEGGADVNAEDEFW